MIDSFTYWTRVMSAWGSVGETRTRLAEIARASHDVIASRSVTIGQAMRSPLDGDYDELGRMVPEKVAAFAASGNAAMQAWWTLQAACIEQVGEVSAVLLRGRPPTLAELADLSSRSTMHGLRALETGSRMGRDVVRPVHRAATANAKRLRKQR